MNPTHAARRRRRIRPWQIPLDGRPLSHHEVAEARAITIALLLATAVLKNEQFPDATAPIPDDLFDTRLVWLRRQLQPLAAQSRIIRDVCTILDDTDRTAWDDPRRLARAVRRLQRQARRLQAGVISPAGPQCDPDQ